MTNLKNRNFANDYVEWTKRTSEEQIITIIKTLARKPIVLAKMGNKKASLESFQRLRNAITIYSMELINNKHLYVGNEDSKNYIQGLRKRIFRILRDTEKQLQNILL